MSMELLEGYESPLQLIFKKYNFFLYKRTIEEDSHRCIIFTLGNIWKDNF